MKELETKDPPPESDLSALVEYCRRNADLPIGMLRTEIERRQEYLRNLRLEDEEVAKDTILLFKLHFVMAELIVEALSNQLDPRSISEQRETGRRLTRQQILWIAERFGIANQRLNSLTAAELDRTKELLGELRKESIESRSREWRCERLNHSLDPVGGHNSDTLLRDLCTAPQAAKTTHAVSQLHGPLGEGQQASAPFIRKS